MENLEKWSSVMEEKMPRFNDVVDRVKSAISNVKKKEKAKTNHEEMFRIRMQQEMKIQG